MLHDLVATSLATLADAPPSDNSTSGVIVALIGIFPATLATIVVVMQGRNTRRNRRRDRDEDDAGPRPHPLNSEDDEGEDPDPHRRKIRAYELFLWRIRYDPTRIRTGREDPASVRII